MASNAPETTEAAKAPKAPDPSGLANKASQVESAETTKDPPAAARDKSTTSEKLTPMMAQYLAIKEEAGEALLFYRMGDFYELFFKDAEIAAAALDITLTKRGKHQGDDIPMCGVPVHAAESYLSRLIRKGHRVAVCEQMEDPAEAKKRGSKAVVRRDVVRVITPGTLTEDAFLDSRRHNYLAALADAEGRLGLAWLDLSTGAFRVQPVSGDGLGAALARIAPGELLLPDRLLAPGRLGTALEDAGDILTPQPGSRFDSEAARRRLEKAFGVASLDGFGAFTRAETAACGALLDYVELTQRGKAPRFSRPERIDDGAALEIDAATRRNLELTETLTGDRRGSLIATVDRTVTGAGGRLLAERIAAPLTDIAAIADRLDAVAWFIDQARCRDDARDLLASAPDIERALSRLSLGRGGPRDLAAIRDGLMAATVLREALQEAADGAAASKIAAGDLARAVPALGAHTGLIDMLTAALDDELPHLARDGGFIRSGYSTELDDVRTLRDKSRQHIAALQTKYADATGVASLKVRHNNVLGYFIEVTATHSDKITGRDDGLFVHRQTMANAMRFTTVELGELEGRISSAGDRAKAIETALFDEMVGAVGENAEGIAIAAGALAEIDVAAAGAVLAVERRYCRPVLTDGTGFRVAGGRHPVVEAALAAGDAGTFVSNDCDLADDRRLWLLTGPNMAGKSTFLRQNALIAILAQAGCYVPAEAAEIGIVDRLFSRVGAADDLARGRSTFMVEMVETAAILNQATERSFVILDEIGRGTATYDGLSIAWATLENLHEVNRCRALFATHFHELTGLTARLDALNPATMRVKEFDGEVVFLHEVVDGAADRSYGIHVARLAGLPDAVIARADEVLKTLEADEPGSALTRLSEDLPLFAAAAPVGQAPSEPSAVDEALGAVNPDELSPREALDLIYRLKSL